ncbi:DUF885 domain-containing protein [Porphyrobacter sp. ULC335]|uniref:DUF885 domain-containing protein n=1 Tax=Porphyrobacter sp. ULC335 TaxID=2854260 RepID=UPI00221FD6EB|nr:DUF885 domain-containing protein [Porphyrobacter sp. ULC335]UYV16762.1 DUF885 domain-containing protein [Porphyrobacter sp. ULC335]
MRSILGFLAAVFLWAGGLHAAGPDADYDKLVALHDELQEFMLPGFTTGVVMDSGARIGDVYADTLMAEKLAGLDHFEKSLAAMPVQSWSRAGQVDFLAVKSILNGYRFNLEVLRPWKRDPGFYLDPLMGVAFTDLAGGDEKVAQLRARLRMVPPLLASARQNLTEVAGDYADLAIHNLENSDGVNHYHPYRKVPPAGIIGWYDDLLARSRAERPDITADVAAARAAVAEFRDWLRDERPRMAAPGGVGAERYDWYIRHVRMIPLTAGEMVTLAEREHERMTAALALLRHRNRNLPALTLSQSAEEQAGKVSATDKEVRRFLTEEDIVTIPDFVGELGSNTPYIERPGGPNFWEQIQFRDPIPDHLHAVIPGHRFDAVLAARDTRPIRGRYSDGARAEGWATYLEEAMMLAGGTRHTPRADEFMELFGIFRAARVPADIYMQHNRWSVAEAVSYMRAKTPWLDEDVARVDAEIYLRRPPGYGVAYTIGKLQMDALLADRASQLGDAFSLREFHDAFLASGRLPIALVRYEMTGADDEVALFWQTPPIPGGS